MAILGTGIDLVALPRIAQSLQRFGASFIARVLTESESAAIPENTSLGEKDDQTVPSPRLVAFVAARFAAKEAAAKALGTGFAEGVTLKDFSVFTGKNGEPILQLSGQAQKLASAMGVMSAHLSLSHERDMACATVILEGQPVLPPPTHCAHNPGESQKQNREQNWAQTSSGLSPSHHPQAPAHKGQAGRVLVVGGSTGMAGAPLLAAHGALRGGAGHVTLAAPLSVLQSLSIPPDFTTLPLPDTLPPTTDLPIFSASSSVWQPEYVPLLAPVLAKCQAVVTGMGTTTMPVAFLQALLALPARPPFVLDAGALRTLALAPHLASLLTEHDIATPHAGEASALLASLFPTANHIRQNKTEALNALTDFAPCVWVLKGAGEDNPTLVGQKNTAKNTPHTPCPVFAPALAVAGSGDVLAGLLAALCAQGYSSREAAVFGVFCHAQAGLLLQKAFPRRGNFASEIAFTLPTALAQLLPPF